MNWLQILFFTKNQNISTFVSLPPHSEGTRTSRQTIKWFTVQSQEIQETELEPSEEVRNLLDQTRFDTYRIAQKSTSDHPCSYPTCYGHIQTTC